MQSHNPAGTDGFAFLEYTSNNPDLLIEQFKTLGFRAVAQHKDASVKLFQQHDILFLLNTDERSIAKRFAGLHGAAVSAMGFRVKNAKAAFQHALAKGATPYTPTASEMIYDIPAIYGVGGSLIYFVDYHNDVPNYQHHFTTLSPPTFSDTPVGLTYIDHVTHNLHRGNMRVWAEFYERIFNFKEIRYFDIEGKLTGLKSQAMTSPCTKIRIPLNESSDDKSQIEEFIKLFNGEGIQHIALGSDDIYQSVEQLKQNGLAFLNTPDTYYELLEKRLPGHGEPVDRLRTNRILIDGNTHADNQLLLQIFTKNMLGPVFFEVIQRKGDEGFGEGNFRALFESIELDQIQRGVLTAETTTK